MKRSIWAFAAAVACAGACAGTATARTANTVAATKACDKVSASSVSAIVGHTVPAPVGIIISEKAMKKNDDIAFQTLDCTYGAEKSLADLKNVVSLDYQTYSRALTSAELKKFVAQTQKTPGLGLKITPYSGLGGTSFYMTASADNFHIESLITASGTKAYGATVETTTSQSKLVSLVKLAENL